MSSGVINRCAYKAIIITPHESLYRQTTNMRSRGFLVSLLSLPDCWNVHSCADIVLEALAAISCDYPGDDLSLLYYLRHLTFFFPSLLPHCSCFMEEMIRLLWDEFSFITYTQNIVLPWVRLCITTVCLWYFTSVCYI